MKYKKLLITISIVIAVMFAFMLAASYAWYSFTNARTDFEVVTAMDEVEITFMKGEYINTTMAVPITADDAYNYAESHDFVIKTKNDTGNENELLTTISLEDIEMDSDLKINDLKFELYYQGQLVSKATGNLLTGSSYIFRQINDSGTILSNDLLQSLDEYNDNNFQLRMYILKTDNDQSALMNKTFKAKVSVNVVSRLKLNKTDFSDDGNPDILVSSITVDGKTSKYIPTEGLYNMSATCGVSSNSSKLSWDSLSKTLTYDSGFKMGDTCSLSFTKRTDKIYLKDIVPVANDSTKTDLEKYPYIAYVGNNGCEGKACEGYNANYVNDDDMGWCNINSYRFSYNGWRAYKGIADGEIYLISAGAPECVLPYIDCKTTSSSTISDVSTAYYYGASYTFNDKTGQFTVTEGGEYSWSTDMGIISSDKLVYSCMSNTSTTCSELYEIILSSSTITSIKSYTHSNTSCTASIFDTFQIPFLNNVSLKYCNSKYIKNGECNLNTVWAMGNVDFKNIIGNSLRGSMYGYKEYGYINELIDIGGYYWFNSSEKFYWFPINRDVASVHYYVQYGVRPIINLDSGVLVVGGSGTYKDPYQIDIE